MGGERWRETENKNINNHLHRTHSAKISLMNPKTKLPTQFRNQEKGWKRKKDVSLTMKFPDGILWVLKRKWRNIKQKLYAGNQHDTDSFIEHSSSCWRKGSVNILINYALEPVLNKHRLKRRLNIITCLFSLKIYINRFLKFIRMLINSMSYD